MISESVVSGDKDTPYNANVYRSESMIIQWKQSVVHSLELFGNEIKGKTRTSTCVNIVDWRKTDPSKLWKTCTSLKVKRNWPIPTYLSGNVAMQ